MAYRKIIHVDMDCFYAAVEEKYNPSLRGKPVAVGGPPDSRAVVCTANYEARKFGVRAAIPSSQARRLCPQLIFVPPHFELYKKESRAVRKILEDYTSLIQPLSLDEAYLDVTASSAHQGSATLIAREIRQRIAADLKLTASAGVAPNKFLAKIASDWRKPNGQFVIRPQDVEAFMPSLPVGKIWGVGRVTTAKMNAMGLMTCGDLQKLSLFELKLKFGARRAQELFHICRGLDERLVRTDFERKSLSVEETFHRDRQHWEEIVAELPALYLDWYRRMEKAQDFDKIRGFSVKLKYFDFKSTTHEQSGKQIPQLEDFEKLLKAAWQKRPEPLRLLGLGVRLSNRQQADDGQLQFAVSIK